MLNYEEIREEIERLEHGPTTYASVEKLAMLYQVMNHAPDRAEEQAYSYSAASDSDSEFLQAFKSAPIDGALSIIDEHMTAIQALYPREYAAVIRKIRDLN